MTDSKWIVCLDGAQRIERDGEIIAWLYTRMWEQLLIELALKEGAPAMRADLAEKLWPGQTSGRKRLSEVTFELRVKLEELGIPESAVWANRFAVGLGPVMALQVREP